MEEKRLTEKESLELITEMIQNTKSRVQVGDGNQMLLWGYLSVGVALLVYVVGMLGDPRCNWLWFLIPLLGFPVELYLKHRCKYKPLVRTYVDRISLGIWSLVGGMCFVGIALCLAFTFSGYGTGCWLLMLFYAFILVGFAVAAQGVIIRERSLVVGGVVSLVAGGFIVCCVLSGIPVKAVWGMPLYMLCFTMMMIVPGHIINRKARNHA